MLVVGLTSIPPRFATLGATLESLLSQDRPPDAIRLTIPARYRRFPDWDGWLPALPAGVTLCRSAEDDGPATKWLPAAAGLRDTAARLLICDDDWIYGPGWAAAALDGWRPGRAVTGAAFPATRLGAGSGTVAQGFSGVLFRPADLPHAAWQPPACAWSVDDVWLSGMLALGGLGIAEVPAMRAACRPHAGEDAPLQRAAPGGLDRAAANRATADHLAQAFRIWR